MENVIEITICLGSSCFSRGNKHTLQTIKDYIKKHNLENRVKFKGNHCFSNCVNGPVVKINDTEYYHMDQTKIIELLNTIFNK